MSGIGPVVGPASAELSYVEITSNVSIVSTSAGAPTNIITSGVIATDGGTRIRIEFCTTAWFPPAAGSITMHALLTEVSVGAKGQIGQLKSAAGAFAPVLFVREFTPTAGTHQYQVGGWCDSSSGTVVAGDGTGSNVTPAFLRISRA